MEEVFMTLLRGSREEVCVTLHRYSYRLEDPLEVERSHEPDGPDGGIRLRTRAQEGVDEIISGGKQRPQRLERLEGDVRALLQTTVGFVSRSYTPARSWKTENGRVSPYTWFVSR